MTASIPTPDDLTIDWFEHLLRRHGHHRVEIRSFDAEPIGTGQIGRCLRFRFDYAEDDGAPATLVGKFPSDDPTSRAAGVALKNYLKEVTFYRELVERVSIRTPRCYFAEIVDAGPEFALVLEDLAPARPGNQLVGCEEPVARAAVLELVGLHAPGWNDRSLLGRAWLDDGVGAGETATTDAYREQLPGFIDRYGSRLGDAHQRIIQAAGERSGAFLPRRDPFSLIHVDYRLDNLLIDERSDPPAVTTVDWQSITLGPPLNDVAYFLGAGMLAEPRRAVEESIVREYHERLCGAGIDGYDWTACWNDYRRGAFAGFAVTVIASMLVQRTKRGDDMFVAMATRHSEHALDLGAEEFLD